MGTATTKKKATAKLKPEYRTVLISTLLKNNLIPPNVWEDYYLSFPPEVKEYVDNALSPKPKGSIAIGIHTVTGWFVYMTQGQGGVFVWTEYGIVQTTHSGQPAIKRA